VKEGEELGVRMGQALGATDENLEDLWVLLWDWLVVLLEKML
jgi:hypothetical protein